MMQVTTGALYGFGNTLLSLPDTEYDTEYTVVRRGLDWRAGHKGLSQWDILAEVLKAFPPPSRPPKKMAATP